jgi:hypothetical protein
MRLSPQPTSDRRMLIVPPRLEVITEGVRSDLGL